LIPNDTRLFDKDNWNIPGNYNSSNLPSYQWTVHSAIIIFLVAYHAGVGPLSWTVMIEIIPCRTPIEAGVAAVSSCWWAFSLAFSMTLIHVIGESTPIGLPGLCAIYAVVACLLYAFILQAVPPSKKTHNRSLCQIERYFDTKYSPSNEEESHNDNSELGCSGIKINLKKNDLTSVTSDVEERKSSTST